MSTYTMSYIDYSRQMFSFPSTTQFGLPSSFLYMSPSSYTYTLFIW